MKKFFITVLIIYFNISCTTTQKGILNNSTIKESIKESISTNIELKEKEKVKVAIFDEIDTNKIKYDNYTIDMTNFNKKEKNEVSHGEKVAVNLLNFSKNVDVKINNVDINNYSSLNENTKRYISDGYKLFNFSFSVRALTENLKDHKDNLRFYELGLNNMKGIFNNFNDTDDVVAVIAAGNSMKSLVNNRLSTEYVNAIKKPPVTIPAAYPLEDKKYSKNIIAAIGIIPEYIIKYDDFFKNKLLEKTENHVPIDKNFKFYDDYMNYYLYSSDGYYFSKASKSRLWSVAADAMGIFKSDENSDKFDIEVLGSSFSAPKILATLAEVKYKYPFLNNKQAKSVVLSTANRNSIEGLSEYIGWGILDVDKALKGPSNFNKALVKNDSLNEVESENYKYFVVNIPNSEYIFSNDIYGGIKKPTDVSDYTEDELEVFVDSGLKKLGNGKLILNGEQKYNEPILLKEGFLEINNNVLNEVRSYSNLEFTNKIKENIDIGSVILNSSNMSTNVNLNIKNKFKIDNLSTLKIGNNIINTEYLEIDTLNNISTEYVLSKRNLITSANNIIKNKNIEKSIRNYIEYKIENNNIVVERKNNTTFSEEPISILLNEVDSKIENNEKVEDKVLNKLTNIVNSSDYNDILKESANIYVSSNIALFDTINLINRQVNSQETLFYKDNISFDFNYLNSKYKNEYSMMNNNIFGTSISLEKAINRKYLMGFKLTYNKNITEYENIFDKLDSDFVNLTQYNKIIFSDFRYRLNTTLGYARENATRDKNIKSNVNNYIFSIDNSLELKTPVVKPYIGVRYDLIFKENIKENGDGLLFDIKGSNFSKTKLYFGANTLTTLGKINFNIFVEGSYNILKRINNLNAKYNNFNSDINLTGFIPNVFDYEIGIDANMKITEKTSLLLNLTKTSHTNMMKLGFEYRY